jgi:hypothetical protein
MNPLLNFQIDHTNEMGELHGFLSKPSTKLSLVFGLSILADSGCTKEEIHGATLLINALEKMSKPPEKMPEFPDKSVLLRDKSPEEQALAIKK